MSRCPVLRRTNVDIDLVSFTESDWNDQDVEIVNEKGDDAPGSSVYGASKTLAERALWGECR